MTTETLGQRIKKERLAQAMTQRDLAEAAGITVPYVSKIEAGKETPTEEKIIRLAEALRLDADELTLAAGRVPQDVMNQLTADPKKALEFLRTMPK
jgi:transcriptional regulator with XRE-family HTH domain